MTIGIDINDVLRDNSRQFLKIYRKFVDDSFKMDGNDPKDISFIDDYDFMNVFPFESQHEYQQFKYVTYPFELFGRAEPIEKNLPYVFNDWTQRTLRDLDEENVPNIIIVSPYEIALTIQASLSFMAANSFRNREYYFPLDSMTIWDRCDILITANPNLIKNAPEGKIPVKIEMPYNKDVECKLTFDSLMSVIKDENDTIIKILEGKNE